MAQTLQGKPGVRLGDMLEGPPDVIMMLQACTSQKLANLTVKALASVETMTESVKLLPTLKRSGSRASQGEETASLEEYRWLALREMQKANKGVRSKQWRAQGISNEK